MIAPQVSRFRSFLHQLFQNFWTRHAVKTEREEKDFRSFPEAEELWRGCDVKTSVVICGKVVNSLVK